MTAVNPKVTSIPINAQGGLMTNIALTIMASKVEVMEDPAYNNGILQGLQGYMIDTQPGVSTPPIENPQAAPPQASPSYLFTWLPNNNGQEGRAYEPIIFGGQDGRTHGAYSDFVGAQGTTILQLTTNGPNAGAVLLVEWP
jgi:hypothetical protein